MSILSGQSISQFNNFEQNNKILSNYHFITSQQLDVNLQNTSTYISKSLSYDKLAGQLFKDLSAAFDFKSMAYELSDQYSNINHTHNYNFFDISPNYNYNDVDENGNFINTVLATFKINNKIVRLCMPKQWRYEDPGHLIGELKFKILPNIINPSNININSDNFDGWVYPNGQSYTVASTDFQAAKQYFEQDVNSTTLTIPCLNNFIKANPTNNISVENITFKNSGVPRHNHNTTIRLSNNDTKEVGIDIFIADTAGDGGSFHRGAKPYDPNKEYKASLALSVDGLTINDCTINKSDSSLDREQYPTYNYLPVMIYIGKK